MADGKITPTTPWGFVAAPRKTKDYVDIVSVFDEGPLKPGVRQLVRHVYVWDGNHYLEYSQGSYPPEAANAEMKAFLQKLEQLPYQSSYKAQKK